MRIVAGTCAIRHTEKYGSQDFPVEHSEERLILALSGKSLRRLVPSICRGGKGFEHSYRCAVQSETAASSGGEEAVVLVHSGCSDAGCAAELEIISLNPEQEQTLTPPEEGRDFVDLKLLSSP